MINQLEFLFSNLKSVSRDTAMLEMFDWNEENLEKFNQEVAHALTLHEMSSPEALVDFLIATAEPYAAIHMRKELKNVMKELVEHSIIELNNLYEGGDN